MVVLGIVGALAAFVLPWIRGLFSIEKQSRDVLTSLTEQRIDEGDLKNHLTNSSIMRSGLVTCTGKHLLIKGETPLGPDKNILLNEKGQSIEFVSSKTVGIGTVVGDTLKVTISNGFVSGSLLFLRSVTGDNQQHFVRVKDVNSSTGAVTFDYDFNSLRPAFTSCSIQNPPNAQSYMRSFENKRFSVEIVRFVKLELVEEPQGKALCYKLWPRQGFQGLKAVTATDITDSKLYDSIELLKITETFDGKKDSPYGNYFVTLNFESIKNNTVADGSVGIAGPQSYTRNISGAYSTQGLEIGNSRVGTATAVKAPKVTCSVMNKKFTKAFKDEKVTELTDAYEVKVLFSDAASINTSTNPLNGSMNISAVGSSSDPDAVRCYRYDQYNPSTKSFSGNFSKGEMGLATQGGSTFSNPMYCFFKTSVDMSGKITYLALTGSTAKQYFIKCEAVRVNPE